MKQLIAALGVALALASSPPGVAAQSTTAQLAQAGWQALRNGEGDTQRACAG